MYVTTITIISETPHVLENDTKAEEHSREKDTITRAFFGLFPIGQHDWMIANSVWMPELSVKYAEEVNNEQ
jgi:hypothetical protein